MRRVLAKRFGWRQQQSGMTLIETILAVSLSSIVMLPMLGWAIVAFREQPAAFDRNVRASDVGLLRTYLPRDVTPASGAAAGGTDCTGGTGAGTVVLVLEHGASDRVVYTTAAGSEGGTSLWRRECSGTSAPSATAEVVADVASGGVAVTCGARPGLTGDSCGVVTVRVSTTQGHQASVSAARRVNSSEVSASSPTVFIPPVVALAASGPTIGGRDLVVPFSSAGSSDPGGSALSYHWDFGDGSSPSSAANPTHTYTQLGTFNVVLTVTNDAGTPASTFIVVEVRNRPPVAVIATPSSTITRHRGQVVSFSALGSNDDSDDPYGSIASYSWRFGDGSTATGATPNHTFQTLSPTGGFAVELTVTDNDGGTATATRNVIVSNRVPVVTISANRLSGASPLSVDFNSTVVDEPGMATPPPLTYSWDFGNGQTSNLANPLATTYNSGGSYTVTLTVTDDAYESASASANVSVNGSPIAGFDPPTMGGRAPYTVNFQSTSTDPDGSVVDWNWDFGNGTSSDLEHPGNRTFTHNVTSGDTFVSATYTVTLTVTDNAGATSTISRPVTVTGAPYPTNFRKTAGGTAGCGFLCWRRYIIFAWDAVPSTNLYQIDLQCTSWLCSNHLTVTFSGSPGRVGQGGTGSLSGDLVTGRDYAVRIRARDSNTGLWGAWSPTINVNSL